MKIDKALEKIIREFHKSGKSFGSIYVDDLKSPIEYFSSKERMEEFVVVNREYMVLRKEERGITASICLFDEDKQYLFDGRNFSLTYFYRPIEKSYSKKQIMKSLKQLIGS